MNKSKPLVLFAHPSLQKSHTHREIHRSLQGIEHCTIQDLYELYPNFFIDIGAQQSLLIEHDVVVMQFPVHWFGMPAILKQWIDLVLESGFAYGKDGSVLKGKKLMCVVSTGADEASYNQRLDREFNIKELFAPIEQTARYCQMEYLPPYVIYDAHNQSKADMAKHEADLYWLFDHFDLAKDKELSDKIDINQWVQDTQLEKQ